MPPLTRNFYDVRDVADSLYYAISDSAYDEALFWFNELIESEEIDMALGSLVRIWALLYGAQWGEWLDRAAGVMGCDEIDGDELEMLIWMLCDARERRVGRGYLMEAIRAGAGAGAGLAQQPSWPWAPNCLDRPAWNIIRRICVPMPLGKPLPQGKPTPAVQPQEPRQYRARVIRTTWDAIGYDLEENMRGCAYWDRLLEEYGGDTLEFIEAAYGQLGYPDEWNAEEKNKSHGLSAAAAAAPVNLLGFEDAVEAAGQRPQRRLRR